MKKLYKYSVGLYDSFDGGLFVSTDEEIKKYLGTEIYWGEIDGKHSEVVSIFEEGDLEVVSINQEFIEFFESGIGSFGYNPIEKIKELK
jgi:predicted ATP-grasp superfamily ATP-dependent carboligase